MELRSVQYSVDVGSRIATITLNRPEKLNAIDKYMPREIRACVEEANADDRVHVIIVQGAGRGFCSGYDLKEWTGAPRESRSVNQPMPFDPTVDFQYMWENTQDFMALWRSLKPAICKVHGAGAIAGGSDIALCCDMVLMAEEAQIGYPPTRVYGCPTTAMWEMRLGIEKAKRMLLTGDMVNGLEAAKMGLILEAVPGKDLDKRVEQLARRVSAVPRNQLIMQKLVLNQAAESNLVATQRLATLFDGFSRHSAEGLHFQQRLQEAGLAQAVAERDGGAPISQDLARPSIPKLRSRF